MPGILGAFSKEYKQDCTKARRIFEGMVAAIDPENRFRVDRFFDDALGVTLGRVSLGILNAHAQPMTDEFGHCTLVFHGELYNRDKMASDTEFVLKRYIEAGDAFAADLTGVFQIVILDHRKRQLKLVSDKFGLQPLYYATFPLGVIFSGEAKALLLEKTVARIPDECSIADFLHYGQVLCQKTLFRDIKLVPPGTVVTFDLQGGPPELKSYWQLASVFSAWGKYSAEKDSSEAVSSLIQAIRCRATHKNKLGLSLSGGLDSRGVLAGLGEEAKGLCTYTLGLVGCADQALAERMSRAAGTRHEFIELDHGYIGNFEQMATEMIRLSDGMYHPHESTEMLALDYFKRAPFKILLRGHGGEVAKAALAYPVMAGPQVYNCKTGKEILDYIFQITNLVVRDIDTRKLFRPAFENVMHVAPMQSLRGSCGEVSEFLGPADVCLYYYIKEHIRRQVVASLEIFRTRIEIRLPYLDETYFKALLALPVQQRNSGEIHTALIRRCMPALIKIPNSNTGAPLDAGPLRLFLTDKFSSLMKRLSVKGFRHYTEFQRWHREGFREHSRRIIFDERTDSRGFYNMDHLKSVFDAHLSGKKDYGHLLGTIVGLELWFREFVDK